MEITRKRPLGIWLFSVPYILVSCVAIYSRTYDRLRECYWPCHRMPISETHVGIVELAGFVLLLVGSAAILVARRWGRVMLVGLALVTGVGWYYVYEVARAKAQFNYAQDVTWPELVQVPMCMSVWLAFNCWYFLGARTRAYFSSGRT